MRAALALAAIFAIWVAAAFLWAATIGAELADAQQVVPTESAVEHACTTAYQMAIVQHLNAEKCRVVSLHDEGRTALVTVKVKITGQGWFNVSLALQRSAWTQSAITVSG